jgi:hypothetical protein
MKKMVFVLSLVGLVTGMAGVAAAAPGHGGRGGGAAVRSVPHAGPRAVAPRGAWRGHRGAWHGHHGFHRGFRSGVFVGVTPFVWDPFPPPVYVPSPPVVVEPPPVYVEQPKPGFWYYCPSAGGYYPTVPSCPEPWVPVPPSGG